jgi:hypothetical protein
MEVTMQNTDKAEGTAGKRSSDEPPFEHPLFRPMAPEDRLEEGESVVAFVQPKSDLAPCPLEPS